MYLRERRGLGASRGEEIHPGDRGREPRNCKKSYVGDRARNSPTARSALTRTHLTRAAS